MVKSVDYHVLAINTKKKLAISAVNQQQKAVMIVVVPLFVVPLFAMTILPADAIVKYHLQSTATRQPHQPYLVDRSQKDAASQLPLGP